jgi:hypothetical protein
MAETTFEDPQMEMQDFILNEVLEREGQDYKVENCLYRKVIHENEKNVLEMWDLGDDKVSIFFGKYPGGQWTSNLIEFYGIFQTFEVAKQEAIAKLTGKADSPSSI